MLENLTERKSFSETQMAKISNTVVSDHKKKIKLVFYIKGLEKGHRKKPYVLKYFHSSVTLFIQKCTVFAILKLDRTFQFEEKRLNKMQYSHEPMNLQ